MLELAALVAVGYWGWQQAGGILQFLLALGNPLIWMTLWALFNVPDDPSRSGKAPIRVGAGHRALVA